MSSFVRRIQRQLAPSRAVHPVVKRDGSIEFKSNPARNVFYGGRGSRLGIVNPKDPCRTGKRKPPKVWRDKRKVARNA